MPAYLLEACPIFFLLHIFYLHTHPLWTFEFCQHYCKKEIWLRNSMFVVDMPLTYAINWIVLTCCQAIVASEGPNPSNIFLLHAEIIDWLTKMRIGTQFPKKHTRTDTHIHNQDQTWFPPFWSASTSWEVNLAIDTDFTLWVNSRLEKQKYGCFIRGE